MGYWQRWRRRDRYERCQICLTEEPLRESIKTPYQAIIQYWAVRQDECTLSIDWSEAGKRCWRCAYRSTLHRCHIVPHALGGMDAPSNLVLLCQRCHREAPNVSDVRFMWIWLRAHRVKSYDVYWSERGEEEFERMFGRKPFLGVGLTDAHLVLAETYLIEELESTIVHFGEGRLNPATIACVMARVEERLTGSTLGD